MTVKTLIELFCIISIYTWQTVYSWSPGPQVIATKGGMWPKPQHQNKSDDYFVLSPNTFYFKLSDNTESCDILQNALNRYWQIIHDNGILIKTTLKYRPQDKNKTPWKNQAAFLGYLEYLEVNLQGHCDDNAYPSLEMIESYDLWVNTSNFILKSTSLWGILRGLDTFSQLVYLGDDGLSLHVNATEISDYPRYKHRGLMIDTARHYIPVKYIFTTLDAMSYNKMNVLHWHIVDDQSFPYVSERFPELSASGAYNPYTKVYKAEDIKEIIEYARIRGIRVIPEFDTPGHTSSWGLSHPEILTDCQVFGGYGPMDPSKNITFSFMNELLTEIRDIFQDKFIHLGGDEVDFDCWTVNKNITAFMKKKNITTYEGLEGYYIQKVVDMTEQLKFNSVVWEEVFTNGVKLPKNTVVHVWKSDWTTTMKTVTQSGQKALLSSCWYLDDLEPGGDWNNFYSCDPTDFDGTEEEQKLVLGGEACMWSEVVNEYNFISRVWPRASAIAEKLWSANDDDWQSEEVEQRIEEHTCRLNRRGIEAQPPNGPGFCD